MIGLLLILVCSCIIRFNLLSCMQVCGMTVTSRVKEFEHTPSAMLTLDQFNTVELDSEADPPVYTRNKFREVINIYFVILVFSSCPCLSPYDCPS